MSELVCPIHGIPFKTFPAGISKKTNKPYASFTKCPEMSCQEKPPKPGESTWSNPEVHSGAENMPPPPRGPEASTFTYKSSEDKPDWDGIARGKVRSLFCEAVIQNQGLIPLSSEMKEILEQYVNYAMDGK